MQSDSPVLEAFLYLNKLRSIQEGLPGFLKQVFSSIRFFSLYALRKFCKFGSFSLKLNSPKKNSIIT